MSSKSWRPTPSGRPTSHDSSVFGSAFGLTPVLLPPRFPPSPPGVNLCKRRQMATPGLEHRGKRRYELAMDLRFSYRHSGTIWRGAGRTRDLSDQAVCFEHDVNAPDGTEMELRIAWPQRLQSVCDLELVIHGVLMRSDSGRAVLRIGDYEFRTCGERSFDQSAGCGSSWNVVG